MTLLKLCYSITQTATKPFSKFLHCEPCVSKCHILQYSGFRGRSIPLPPNCNKNILSQKCSLKTAKQADTPTNRKHSIRYKVLLVSSGLVAVSYYVVHSEILSGKPSKPWKMITKYIWEKLWGKNFYCR